MRQTEDDGATAEIPVSESWVTVRYGDVDHCTAGRPRIRAAIPGRWRGAVCKRPRELVWSSLHAAA